MRSRGSWAFLGRPDNTANATSTTVLTDPNSNGASEVLLSSSNSNKGGNVVPSSGDIPLVVRRPRGFFNVSVGESCVVDGADLIAQISKSNLNFNLAQTVSTATTSKEVLLSNNNNTFSSNKRPVFKLRQLEEEPINEETVFEFLQKSTIPSSLNTANSSAAMDDDWLEGAVAIGNEYDERSCANNGSDGDNIHHVRKTSKASAASHPASSSSSAAAATSSVRREVPWFATPPLRATEPLLLPGHPTDHTLPAAQINGFIAQYLLDHQVDGVKWLWKKYIAGKGCILGDDMGMGKTCQVICIMLALFGRTGNREEDEEAISERHQNYNGGDGGYCKPVLVIMPKAVLETWAEQLTFWGILQFAKVEKFADLHKELARVKSGRTEVLLVKESTLLMLKESAVLREMMKIEWSVCILDEAHKFKNDKGEKYDVAMKIMMHSRINIFLTGTILQNDVCELWSVINLCFKGRGPFSKAHFDAQFAGPIKQSMNKSCSEDDRREGARTREDLAALLAEFYLRREKDGLSGEERLEGKDDIIVMCDPETLQQMIYSEFLDQAYCRLFRHDLDDGEELGKLVENTALYRLQHIDGPCGSCKNGGYMCLMMPVLTKLLQISSHPGLLQVDETDYNQGDANAVKKHDFLVNTFSPTTVEKLGGPFRTSDWKKISNHQLSGKLRMLMTMLTFFHNANLKVIVFSRQTMILNRIQSLVICRGWGFHRLDGQTSSSDRQNMSKAFNGTSSDDKLIMLISTKAGGVGLNLTGAHKVIVFDVSWNPADDHQAQDRSYRIGQKKHVSVYRLVSKGTIEEMVYLRQLWKQELHASCVDGKEGPQNFDYFELKGMENLLRHTEGESIFESLCTQYAARAADTNPRGRYNNYNHAVNEDEDDDEHKATPFDTSIMPVSFLLENTKDLPLQEAGTQSVSDLALGYQPLDSSSVAISALDVLGVSRASAHLNGDMLKRKRETTTPAVPIGRALTIIGSSSSSNNNFSSSMEDDQERIYRPSYLGKKEERGDNI